MTGDSQYINPWLKLINITTKFKYWYSLIHYIVNKLDTNCNSSFCLSYKSFFEVGTWLRYYSFFSYKKILGYL